MKTPQFYDRVPSIAMVDPLARMLGSAEDGKMEYHYVDAVKLCGHSCPTVAGAWWVTRTALARLYADDTPRRGEIRVELREALTDGVAGVIASVAGLVTGAANAGGFKGLGGRFGRNDLLRFGVPMSGDIRFTRLDTQQAVEFARGDSNVPRPPAFSALLQAALSPNASPQAIDAFGSMWQDWVAQRMEPDALPEWVELSVERSAEFSAESSA